jgi:hypothetical protein
MKKLYTADEAHSKYTDILYAEIIKVGLYPVVEALIDGIEEAIQNGKVSLRFDKEVPFIISYYLVELGYNVSYDSYSSKPTINWRRIAT